MTELNQEFCHESDEPPEVSECSPVLPALNVYFYCKSPGCSAPPTSRHRQIYFFWRVALPDACSGILGCAYVLPPRSTLSDFRCSLRSSIRSFSVRLKIENYGLKQREEHPFRVSQDDITSNFAVIHNLATGSRTLFGPSPSHVAEFYANKDVPEAMLLFLRGFPSPQ